MRSEQAHPKATVDWGDLERRPPGEKEAEMLLALGDPACSTLHRMAMGRTRRTVTYSRNVTIPVTNLCRNRCSYCSFRREDGGFLEWKGISPTLARAQELGCCEALFMSGERPERVHARARAFLRGQGFRSNSQYVAWLCGKTLDETELLPHTNIGVLERDELRNLKEVNASLGLMLEDASRRLCGEGMAHERSPGKDPRERIRTIEEAGRLRIPFTTGLLIGIGQSHAEIARSLMVLKSLQDKYGHIQELIIQRFVPKPGTPMASFASPPTELMLNAFSVARLIFGPSMNLQAPPNIEPEFESFLRAGANDLGGISPLTPDYINPQQAWCKEGEIYKRVSSMGLRTEMRPPVYPSLARPKFLPRRILSRTKRWISKMRLLEREGFRSST